MMPVAAPFRRSLFIALPPRRDITPRFRLFSSDDDISIFAAGFFSCRAACHIIFFVASLFA